MKKSIIFGSITIALGLLVALSPQFIFRICSPHSSTYPLCYWTAQAELGMGMLIVALGLCFIIFPDPKTQIGLTLGILFASILVLGLPYALIGGCKGEAMNCHKAAFPALTVFGSILLLYSVFIVAYIEKKKLAA
jgi:hypothetical protein